MTGAPAAAAETATPARAGAWRRFARNRAAVAGLAVLGLVVLAALIGPFAGLPDPARTALGARLLPPLAHGHLLGTDHLGRDLLARLVEALRTSLGIAAAATLLSAAVGGVLGLTAGYAGRATDAATMRGVDILMAFPYLLLALALIAALGPGLFNALLAVAVVNIPFFTRSVRGVTVALRERDFVAAARLSGLSPPGIVALEILPNVLPTMITLGATTLGWMILETAGLSFLGLGAQPPAADLGSMLGEGRTVMFIAPHVTLVPGLSILVVVVALNLVSDGLRDLIDPRLAAGALARPLPRTAVDAPGPAAADSGPAEAGPADPAGDLLAIRDLEVRFAARGGDFAATRGVDLSIGAGERVGLVGESGSGKSVTALAVLGLVPTPPGRIAGGRILFDGDDLVRTPLAALTALRGRRIAMVFQDPASSLNPLMPVGAQVAEVLRRHEGLSPRAARDRAVDMLGRVRLPDPARIARARPHELSGGMRQRVMIATALACAPDLVLADEPTTALDVTTQARILDLLSELCRDQGSGLLLISHDIAVIAQTCARVAVMYAGEVVETGPTDAVVRRPLHPYTQALLACAPRLGAGRRGFTPIAGRPPRPGALPPGCVFAPRCPHAVDACTAAPVEMGRFPGGRAARCIRVDQWLD
jgi:peptide/nickel transport system permease protein